MAKPEEIELRLSRLNKYYGVEPEGIAFGVLDRNGTIVKCLEPISKLRVIADGL